MSIALLGIFRPPERTGEGRRSGTAASLLGLFLLLSSAAASAEDTKTPETFRDCANCPEMVVLPPGRFLMGSTEQEAEREVAAIPPTPLFYRLLGWDDRKRATRFMANERPQHPVTIPAPFAIGRYPVTVEEFAAFVAETRHETGPCRTWALGRPKPPVSSAWSKPGFPQTPRDPVVCVTRADVQAYARWLSAKVTGGRAPAAGGDAPYRLPSEAEWEYAARGGTQTARWWGEGMRPGFARCNGCDQAPGTEAPDWPGQMTAPVGSFPANPFGLDDMIGNVLQMAQDCWHEDYVGAPADGSTWFDNGACERTVDRGTSWRGSPWTARAAGRDKGRPDEGTNDLGFRLVKVLPRVASDNQTDRR